MKRIFVILSIIALAINSYANNSFDKTKNFQGSNATSYIGEILDVKPIPDLPKGFNAWDAGKHPEVVIAYERFMSYEDFDPSFMCDNTYIAYYHFDGQWLFHTRGTKASELRGKSFKVVKVEQMENYTTYWMFTLVNINDPEDKCVYIYKSEFDSWEKGKFNNFPFTVRKHTEYVKSHK